MKENVYSQNAHIINMYYNFSIQLKNIFTLLNEK